MSAEPFECCEGKWRQGGLHWLLMVLRHEECVSISCIKSGYLKGLVVVGKLTEGSQGGAHKGSKMRMVGKEESYR